MPKVVVDGIPVMVEMMYFDDFCDLMKEKGYEVSEVTEWAVQTKDEEKFYDGEEFLKDANKYFSMSLPNLVQTSARLWLACVYTNYHLYYNYYFKIQKNYTPPMEGGWAQGLLPSTGKTRQAKETTSSQPIKILSAKATTRIGTWNVRTLYQCGKLAQVLREFDNNHLDILGISEMRWTNSGKVISDRKTILYSGQENHHKHGVGLILNEDAARSLISWNPINDRIITARFQTKFLKLTIIQVYAPTEEAEQESKEKFYNQLQDTFDEIPSFDLKILIGDLNAQIGPNRQGLEQTIGPHGSASGMNENGDRFTSFCNINGLIIGNTFFAHKNIHKKTWRAPNGETTNEIDYFCISNRWKSATQDVRSYRGADIGSDHYLLTTKLRLRLKKLGSNKLTPPMEVKQLQDPTTQAKFQLELKNRFQPLQDISNFEDLWSTFRSAVTDSAKACLGRRRAPRKKRWIRDQTWDLIDKRKETKKLRDQASSPESRTSEDNNYRTLDRLVKKSCQEDKKAWIEEKCNEAQIAADRNDSRALYRIVKDLTGFRNFSNTPVKDKNGKTLTSEEDQNKRWIEHFTEVLNQLPPPESHTFDTDTPAGTLDVDQSMISEAEITAAIKSLKNNKAPGLDEISPEMIKNGGQEMVNSLLQMFNKFWEEEKVPDDWKKGTIIKLPKKGNPANCNNWRGITLLSVPGKLFTTILLRRLKDAVDPLLRENQAGFRSSRSCNEQIFTLRNIIEQSVEFQKPVLINFIDFSKAFDCNDS
ncbi:hypothetical protein FO519_009526 [Halicephalobus sp. NKZ332]|nr:hypothetical protein FO519_009526 [Halicephalobus sp. NKZ332]